MLATKCDLKILVRNVGYTVPLQIGGPKPHSSQLNGNNQLQRSISSERIHDIHNQTSMLETTRAVLHRVELT